MLELPVAAPGNRSQQKSSRMFNTDNTDILPRSCCNVMSESSSAASDSELSHTGDTWEVAEILAERKTFEGRTEVLVVWKSCWTSISLVREGPVLDEWRTVTKLQTSGKMAVKLPVVAGTQLHRDYTKMWNQSVAEKRQRHQTGGQANASPVPSGPRKQLDIVALRR
jgi:hypothetical protein